MGGGMIWEGYDMVTFTHRIQVFKYVDTKRLSFRLQVDIILKLNNWYNTKDMKTFELHHIDGNKCSTIPQYWGL